MTTDDKTANLARIIAKAWHDPAFKQRLMASPTETLAEEGHPLPTGVQAKVVEDNPQLKHLVLPPPPQGAGQLTQDALNQHAHKMVMLPMTICFAKR
jgi:hypothetical protein